MSLCIPLICYGASSVSASSAKQNMVLDPKDPNAAYDAGAAFQNTGSGVVQALPNNGNVDAELAAFILANTGSDSSPYGWSDVQLGKAQAAGADPNARLDTMAANAKGHITAEAAAGLLPVRAPLKDVNDVRNDVADVAGSTDRISGVVAASSTAAAVVPGPHQPGAAATAVTATGVGFVAGVIERVARPDVARGSTNLWPPACKIKSTERSP